MDNKREDDGEVVNLRNRFRQIVNAKPSVMTVAAYAVLMQYQGFVHIIQHNAHHVVRE